MSYNPPRLNGASAPKQRLDASKLQFTQSTVLHPVPEPGSPELWAQNVHTDHMLTCRWTAEKGWDVLEIKPFADFTISPLASCIHYATQCFEGMKAYRGFDNRVRLFRPDRNAKRLVMSAKRVSLPEFDDGELVELIKALVRIDAKRWLAEPGSFRYIRPALIGTGRQLGVQIPREAVLFIVIVCWPDFSTESPPSVSPRSDLRLLTSRNDTIRAWPGGFDYAKVGANYGPSFASHCEAQESGYDQILWLFGEDGQVTEAGASNFFAVVKNEHTSRLQLFTAPLDDKVILDGVTRRSVLELVESRLAGELEVKEAKFTIADLERAWKDGRLVEAFVSGTAFFIKDVSTIRVGDRNLDLPRKQHDAAKFGPLIKDWLRNIMFGTEENKWGVVVAYPISSAPLDDLESVVRIISIPAEKLSDVLKTCKVFIITLAALLHALICTSLCRGIKDIPGIRAVTPFSVPKQTGASAREILNLISLLARYIPGTDLGKIENCVSRSTAEAQHIVQLVQYFSADIATQVKQFPHGGMLAHLNRAGDLLSICQSQAGTDRLCTYELSNLGSTGSISTRPGSHLKLDKVIFTQCGMVAGPALGFNCASVHGGPFTISIAWQRGVVAESLIEHVAEDLERRLNHEANVGL